MLNLIRLQSFKRFAELELQLRHLTVLTGLNSAGKSTVLQAILLAHQSSLGGGHSVAISGQPGLELGQAADILALNASSPVIGIELGEARSGRQYRWEFDAGEFAATDSPFLRIIESPKNPPAPIGARDSALTYLSAERLGPRTSSPTAALEPDALSVGEDGRYVAHSLAVGSRRTVAEARRHPATAARTLLSQTEGWMSELIGPVQFDASLVHRTSLATLHLKTGGYAGEWMLPTNVGFGLSYSLPVVVAGLAMPENSVLIVDSPEAHLHPKAQSAMGHFLATIAASGVQVLVETHSDHVLNGIRRSVASDKVIPADDVAILFFGATTPPTHIEITATGSMSTWPEGFFDQIERDLGALNRRRRGV